MRMHQRKRIFSFQELKVLCAGAVGSRVEKDGGSHCSGEAAEGGRARSWNSQCLCGPPSPFSWALSPPFPFLNLFLQRVWMLALPCLGVTQTRNEILREWIHPPKGPS